MIRSSARRRCASGLEPAQDRLRCPIKSSSTGTAASTTRIAASGNVATNPIFLKAKAPASPPAKNTDKRRERPSLVFSHKAPPSGERFSLDAVRDRYRGYRCCSRVFASCTFCLARLLIAANASVCDF